jgi:Fe2+ or Zn2+ uptake regulation protein
VINVQKYIKLLKKNNLKITPQRLEIMRYLDKNMTHPDADTIYSDLKQENPSLSKTTVYNALDTLNQANILQTLTISESERRYDFNKGHHHHFLCKKCNQIYDIEVECPFLNDMLSGEHKVEQVHGYFKGICKNCLKKKQA